MQRRQFLVASASLGAAPLFAQAPSKNDPGKKAEPTPIWHDPKTWGVEGRICGESVRERWYDRFPTDAKAKVTPQVWGLSRHSAGMAVRFKTDSPEIHVRYKLLLDALGMPHMPATGVSGVDLYAKDPEGKWRWVAVTKPASKEISTAMIRGISREQREWMMYLPLYNGVDSLEIGVEAGSSFQGLAPRTEKLAIFYGTSITHGACASRPGMAHVAILGRRLDIPTVNLGFSGNGKMDAAVGDFLVQTDPAIFVIDCSPNMSAAEITERTIPLVKQLRGKHPKTPILLVENRRHTQSWIDSATNTLNTAKQAALKAEFEKLKKEGVSDLHYLSGDILLGDDADGATDGSHPSDLGFFRHADAFEPILRQILKI
jgi:lysophospholipase L1-like esterase